MSACVVLYVLNVSVVSNKKKLKKIEIKVKKNKTKNLFILPVCSFCFTIEYMQENQKTNFLNIQLYKTYTNNSSESD